VFFNKLFSKTAHLDVREGVRGGDARSPFFLAPAPLYKISSGSSVLLLRALFLDRLGELHPEPEPIWEPSKQEVWIDNRKHTTGKRPVFDGLNRRK
jgi:hypothetical protein